MRLKELDRVDLAGLVTFVTAFVVFFIVSPILAWYWGLPWPGWPFQ